MIALDTHFWVWFHLRDKRLTNTVAALIGRDTVISAASVWEVMNLLQKARISSTWPPEETIRKWLAAAPMRVVPVDGEIAILSRTLDFFHDDPADRFIAATAFRCKATLATVDTRLRGLLAFDGSFESAALLNALDVIFPAYRERCSGG